jgi:hypothetical protein
MRLTSFSYFWTCWNVSPRASAISVSPRGLCRARWGHPAGRRQVGADLLSSHDSGITPHRADFCRSWTRCPPTATTARPGGGSQWDSLQSAPGIGLAGSSTTAPFPQRTRYFGTMWGSPPGVPGGGMTGVTPPPVRGAEMPGPTSAGGQITPLDRDNSSLKLALPVISPCAGTAKPPVLASQPGLGVDEIGGGAVWSDCAVRRYSCDLGSLWGWTLWPP